MTDRDTPGTGPSVPPPDRPTASPDAVPPTRELWGSRAGFILAAVGSAVGLGNMWRFPYVTAESGGAAFVLLYILFVFGIGLPVLLAEFTLGRRTRLSPIGALRTTGGRGWSIIGYLFVAAGLLILSYYSVIAGWVTRYMLDSIISGFPGDPGAYFGQATEGPAPIIYHLAFMVLTITIVMGGVEKGIERASLIMMPTLFLVVLGLALWAFSLEGSGQGYSYYLNPSMDELFELETFAAAAGQAFFSLSLGMGAMLTFSSYLSRDENLPREGTIIALSDFGVAFLAGLVVFPIIFALGLQESVTDSTVGALFISIPGAFVEMGAIGRVVGALFFIALFVGALTSAISLLEVVTSSMIDEFRIPRRKAAVGAGGLIAVLGILPAMNIDVLGAMDAIASEVFLPMGGLALAVFVGWVLSRPKDEILRGASPTIAGLLGGWIWVLRVVAPIFLVIVLYTTIPNGIDAVRAIFQGG